MLGSDVHDACGTERHSFCEIQFCKFSSVFCSFSAEKRHSVLFQALRMNQRQTVLPIGSHMQRSILVPIRLCILKVVYKTNGNSSKTFSHVL